MSQERVDAVSVLDQRPSTVGYDFYSLRPIQPLITPASPQAEISCASRCRQTET